MASARGGASLTLAKFHAFLENSHQEAQACHRETTTVRDKAMEAFQAEMVAWQNTYATCYAQLLERRHEMPTRFRDHIDQVEQEELARIRQEIADLAKEIVEKKARSDELLSAANAEVEGLRKTNPGLNDREESLKALMVQHQNEFAEAYEEQETLEDNTWGWMTHFFAIRRLRKQQRQAKKQQQETLLKLRQVRQEWLKQVEAVGDTQATLREEWQQVGVRLAEAQTRHDHLSQNTADLAEKDGLTRVLEELDEAPPLDDALGEALAEMVTRNEIRASYEQALQVTGEFLGRVKGVSTGLAKFAESVADVVKEQRRYNLRQVKVRLSATDIDVLRTWNRVRGSLDAKPGVEKKPKDLIRLLERYNQQVLNDAGIETLFANMGDALSRATDAWN